jgi:hypothetical protein
MEMRVASLHELRSALNAEHEHVWELVSSVRHAMPEERDACLQRLVRYLAVHEAAEQVVIHNAWVDDTTRERIDEEREAADIVDRLVRAAELPPPEDPFDDEFLVILDQLERALRDHAEAEENEELPILASQLAPDDLGEMLRVVRMIRELAEDVATPISAGTYAAMHLAAQKEFTAAASQLR